VIVEQYDEWAAPADLKQVNAYNLHYTEYARAAEEWRRVVFFLGRFVGVDLQRTTAVVEAREQLVAACMDYVPPRFVLEFLRERELSARADDKYVWANLRRDFEAIPRVMMQRRREEEAIGRAIDLRARGRLSPSGLAQLGYYEASLSAAEMGAPHAESANDLARSALEVMLKDGKLEAK